MSKPYNVLVLIGRFQPLHKSHVEMISRASSLCKQLVILIGSAQESGTYKNPWTLKERMGMIISVNGLFDPNCNVYLEGITDRPTNEEWVEHVKGTFSKYNVLGGKVGIVGHKKDDSSFYLDLFPEWELVDVGNIDGINATDVREAYFDSKVPFGLLHGWLNPPIYRYLESWKGTETFEILER